MSSDKFNFRQAIEKKEQELGWIYSPIYDEKDKISGVIEFSGVKNLRGYPILIKDMDGGSKEIIVGEFLQFGETSAKDLLKIIEANEKLAIESGCKYISVYGKDSKLKQLYESKGYNFPTEQIIGGKTLK